MSHVGCRRRWHFGCDLRDGEEEPDVGTHQLPSILQHPFLLTIQVRDGFEVLQVLFQTALCIFQGCQHHFQALVDPLQLLHHLLKEQDALCI